MNISSVVVKTTPEFVETVLVALKETQLCDIHHHDDQGRIIITIEGENLSSEMDSLRVIQKMDHILSAEMMYSYSEDELTELTDAIKNNVNTVPDYLKDDDIKPGKVLYQGDLRNFLDK